MRQNFLKTSKNNVEATLLKIFISIQVTHKFEATKTFRKFSQISIWISALLLESKQNLNHEFNSEFTRVKQVYKQISGKYVYYEKLQL